MDDLQQVSEDYSTLGEFQNMNTLTSQRSYINGFGLPNCKMKGAMKTWMNKHNESHSDGVHYHHFVITKALTSKLDDMVKVLAGELLFNPFKLCTGARLFISHV